MNLPARVVAILLETEPPPRNAREARLRGLNWYIKNGRQYTFSVAHENPPFPMKSHAIATRRNARRKAMGYPDIYSTRERGWPT